jgi:hypothetical protein
LAPPFVSSRQGFGGGEGNGLISGILKLGNENWLLKVKFDLKSNLGKGVFGFQTLSGDKLTYYHLMLKVLIYT